MEPDGQMNRNPVLPGGAACVSLAEVAGPLVRTLVGEPGLTSAEVADQAGVDLDRARRLWRALGFPPVPDDERLFTRADVAMLGAVGTLLAQGSVEPEAVMQLTRITGQALARVAEARWSTVSRR